MSEFSKSERPPQKDNPKITFSTRYNGDGTFRGLCWHEHMAHPWHVVGIRSGEDYATRAEAKAAIRAAIDELGVLPNKQAANTSK